MQLTQFKLPIAFVLGAVVTGLLFLFMSYLVRMEAKITADDYIQVQDFILDKPDELVNKKVRKPPQKPEPPKEPPPIPKVAVQQTAQPVQPPLNIQMDAIKPSLFGTGPVGLGARGIDPNSEGEQIPLVRIEPQYPREAALDGREGWVKLSFTIKADGSVGDVKVIDSKPRRVFDRAARRALLKWKYKPKVVEGKPVPVTGQEVQIDFKLDQVK